MSFIPIYILILFLLIIIDYYAGIFIENAQGNNKKYFLIISIISTCLVLLVFKYFNFFNANFENLANFLHWNYSLKALSLVLPIGLSFHTFQSLAYVIEVYRGRQKAERNFLTYALYVMFFPQLVAGPIERPYNLLHQFYEEHKFEFNRVVSGLELMILGYFKKVVIADRLAGIVNVAYGNPVSYQGTPLILTTFFFAFQIYCDFSGYSDIAIGSARVLGFKLMQNFNKPYFSKSIPEFWRRWHISLSTWFRDYVYIPLGGNRVKLYIFYINILIVFLISGLWHGANWTFVVWGLLHGVYMLSFYLTANFRDFSFKDSKVYQFFCIIFTFILACFGWIFFRANNIHDAFYIISHLFSNIKLNIFDLNLKVSKADIILSFTFIGILVLTEYLSTKINLKNEFIKYPRFIRWLMYLIVVIIILLFGVYREIHFIYFQF